MISKVEQVKKAFVTAQTSVTSMSAASIVPPDSNWAIFSSVSCLFVASHLHIFFKNIL